MKILFDNNVPRQLRRLLAHYEIKTSVEMKWAELANGRLLAVAEENGFDLMITGDKNLSYQQNLYGKRLSVIVLSETNWQILRGEGQAVRDAIEVSATIKSQFIRTER